MTKILIITALFGLACNAPLARADDAARGALAISGYTLAGDSVSLPGDLSAPVTLIVVADDDPDSESLATWRAEASALGAGVPALFLLVMGDRRGLARSMAAGRLRGEVDDPGLRKVLVPVFQDGDDLHRRLGFAAGALVSAVLMAPSGEVIWRAQGSAGAETRAALASVLQGLPPTGPAFALPAGEASPMLDAAPVREAAPVPAANPRAALTAKPERPVAALRPSPVPPPPDVAATVPPTLPEIDATTLSGRRIRLPADIQNGATRLILVSNRSGDDALLSALTAAEAAAITDPTDWLVLLFMGEAPRFGKAVAAGQLRAKLKPALWRDRTVPVYMPRAEFERLAGLTFISDTHSVLATSDGIVPEVID